MRSHRFPFVTRDRATLRTHNRITNIVIVPITEDGVWLERFRHEPSLDLPKGPVMVVAPHPDDETLGAGALIAAMSAQGVRVIVVAATDGENAYDLPPAERTSLGFIRQREQREALEELGVSADAIKRLRLTDSGLMGQTVELERRILEVVELEMTILAPWEGDFHPDHIACAQAASAIARAKKLPLLSYFFWTWHRGYPELLDGLPIRRFEPPPDALAAKARAISRHRSQFERQVGEPILNNRLLAPARWGFEVFLSA